MNHVFWDDEKLDEKFWAMFWAVGSCLVHHGVSGELGKSSIAIRGAMIDEVKAVDTKGVELKTLEPWLSTGETTHEKCIKMSNIQETHENATSLNWSFWKIIQL